jgi:hypothetical protein
MYTDIAVYIGGQLQKAPKDYKIPACRIEVGPPVNVCNELQQFPNTVVDPQQLTLVGLANGTTCVRVPAATLVPPPQNICDQLNALPYLNAAFKSGATLIAVTDGLCQQLDVQDLVPPVPLAAPTITNATPGAFKIETLIQTITFLRYHITFDFTIGASLPTDVTITYPTLPDFQVFGFVASVSNNPPKKPNRIHINTNASTYAILGPQDPKTTYTARINLDYFPL